MMWRWPFSFKGQFEMTDDPVIVFGCLMKEMIDIFPPRVGQSSGSTS